jgi:hypothetical protein
MRTGLVRDLRAILRSHPDGLTVRELADMTGRENGNVAKYLGFMPDTYIDRWEGPSKKYHGQYAAVWCIVVPPDNCPHPTKPMVAVRSRGRKDFAANAPCNRETND